MMTLKMIVHAVCTWILVSKSTEEFDENCLVNCACCIDRRCGRGNWFENECTLGCIDGYRGARCESKCIHNCTKCPNNEDICTACYDGYYLGPNRDCASNCLPGCKTCMSGTTCTSCKEEYYNDNGYNDCRYRKCPKNCKCVNNQCTSCKEGYYDISDSCDSLCPDSCVTCSSSTSCDSCKDGHYNGYQYGNNSHPLLNDCTYKCQDNCVECTSYGVCLVCKTGLYGSVCGKSCSPGCKNGICAIQTGKCDCTPNFVGDKCDRCLNGKYGDMCDKQCALGCKGKLCYKTSGDCIDGCIADTIVGKKCDVCATGWYGTYCNLSCSVGCKNNKCIRTVGECTDGCLNNFKGRQCDQCIIGKYGDLCNIDCSKNCNGKICLKESGNCVKCLENFAGVKCERCEAGFYGPTCSENCPSNCLHDICDRYSRKCSYGCVDSFSGDRCCLNNKNCINCSSDVRCKQCKSGYFDYLCDTPCPKNCADFCDIETGRCDDCRNNFYGDQCTMSCSITCKNDSYVIGSSCKRENGYCRYGCSDGFYGPRCTEQCSSRCVDNICDRENGKCTVGCQVIQEDPFCPINSASTAPSDQSQLTCFVTFGTILAVSLSANVALVAVVIILKLRQRDSNDEKKREPFYVNDRQTTDIELESVRLENRKETSNIAQGANSNNMTKSLDYEDLNSVQVSEHTYGHIETATGLH